MFIRASVGMFVAMRLRVRVGPTISLDSVDEAVSHGLDLAHAPFEERKATRAHAQGEDEHGDAHNPMHPEKLGSAEHFVKS